MDARYLCQRVGQVKREAIRTDNVGVCHHGKPVHYLYPCAECEATRLGRNIDELLPDADADLMAKIFLLCEAHFFDLIRRMQSAQKP